MSGSDPNAYVTGEHDRIILSAAVQLVFRILEADIADDAQRVVVARIGRILARLPAEFDPIDASLTLTGPRRLFGGHEIHHWWTIEVEGERISISSSGYFHRPETGGDSFLSMSWSAVPGEEPEFEDNVQQLRLVNDAAPFEVEVENIDPDAGRHSLEVLLNGDEVNQGVLEDENELDEGEAATGSEAGAAADLPAAERALGILVADAEGVSKALYFSGAPPQCDVCGLSFASAGYMVDGARRTGEWACMCALCFKRDGLGIQNGLGQMYRKQADGRWLLVAGYAG